MELTVANPMEGRLMTIKMEYTKENTTWFDCFENDDIYSITDSDGSLIVKECNYTYPVIIQGYSREDIKFDQQKAKDLNNMMMDNFGCIIECTE